MANIRLKELIEANVDPKLVARSKESGKLVYFKSPEAKAAAMKAGSHEEPKKDKKAQAKQAAQSADMFKGDYSKERGAKDDSNWMDDLDSIDTSDIKGKADPNADSFTSADLYGATFKDPETGKTITVGDAYEREDDSPAYQKAFAYVAKFDPDKEAVMGTQAYDDLQKKAAPKLNLPKKASQLNYDHTIAIADVLNKELGLDGIADSNMSSWDEDNTIMYTASAGDEPTYSLYFGPNDDYNKPNEFRVSLESTYGNDPSNLSGKNDKSFKSAEDAMKYMIELGKKYKKELQMDDGKNESTKLTSMFKK